MPVPNLWPTPNDPDTNCRVFRAEIENPFKPRDYFGFHIAEVASVGTRKTFEEPRSDFDFGISLADALLDAELEPLITTARNKLEQAAYILWLRRVAQIEGGA